MAASRACRPVLADLRWAATLGPERAYTYVGSVLTAEAAVSGGEGSERRAEQTRGGGDRGERLAVEGKMLEDNGAGDELAYPDAPAPVAKVTGGTWRHNSGHVYYCVTNTSNDTHSIGD